MTGWCQVEIRTWRVSLDESSLKFMLGQWVGFRAVNGLIVQQTQKSYPKRKDAEDALAQEKLS